MTMLHTREIIGKRVVTSQGHDIGTVEDVAVDTVTWKVEQLEVRLHRKVLEELHLKRPLVGSQKVSILASDVSGVADHIVLTTSLDQLAFEGGRPSETAVPPPTAQ